MLSKIQTRTYDNDDDDLRTIRATLKLCFQLGTSMYQVSPFAKGYHKKRITSAQLLN